MSAAPHAPVLLAEVLDALAPAPGQTIIDGTFGAGGYSRAILARGAAVIAFDRDPTAARFTTDLASSDRFKLIEATFSTMQEVAGEGGVDGVVLDLGVSSMQLDEAERGFSLMRDGPLDMRMGADGQTAGDLVNDADKGDLARIFRLYGEEREAGRVAASHFLRREGRLYIRIFPHKSVSAKPLEVRMGSGKGEPEFWCAVVKPGTILFEVGGVDEPTAKKCLARLAFKMPIACRFVPRRHSVA